MRERSLRRFCLRLVRDLDLGRPIDPPEMCQRLGEQRGRVIILEARRLPSPGAFGLLVPLPDKDLIVYPEGVSAPYQSQIIFHEVMHLVLGHLDSPTAQGAPLCGDLMANSVGERDPGATLYDRKEEWEAETGATILSEWSASPSPPVRSSRGGLSDAERAAARALGGSGDQ